MNEKKDWKCACIGRDNGLRYELCEVKWKYQVSQKFHYINPFMSLESEKIQKKKKTGMLEMV